MIDLLKTHIFIEVPEVEPELELEPDMRDVVPMEDISKTSGVNYDL